jgi:hypothetical protein
MAQAQTPPHNYRIYSSLALTEDSYLIYYTSLG